MLTVSGCLADAELAARCMALENVVLLMEQGDERFTVTAAKRMEHPEVDFRRVAMRALLHFAIRCRECATSATIARLKDSDPMFGVWLSWRGHSWWTVMTNASAQQSFCNWTKTSHVGRAALQASSALVEVGDEHAIALLTSRLRHPCSSARCATFGSFLDRHTS